MISSLADTLLDTCAGKVYELHDRNAFISNAELLESLHETVCHAFGSNMTREDVMNHVVEPDKVYLLEDDGLFKGMFSYSTYALSDANCIFVDGVALSPQVQSAGLFGKVTRAAFPQTEFVGLKTQNPCMYRALEKLSADIVPSISQLSSELVFELALRIGKDVDEYSVVRGEYGTSLYDSIPYHPRVSAFFSDALHVDYNAGDSVICLGRLTHE